MNYVVTGGAGFVGSHLCQALLDQGHKVTCFDNFSDYYNPAIKEQNIASMLSNPSFKLVKADLRDYNQTLQVVQQNPDGVFHLAAIAGVQYSLKNPALYADNNVTGTLNLLLAMATCGVKRLVFTSSSSVYGNNKQVPFKETDFVDKPISPYAATKKAGELLCHTYHHLYNMGIACLRLFTVYGPRQRPDLAIHKFARKILEGTPIDFYGNGDSRRDYTYVADTVAGFIKAMNWTVDGGFEVFNLGNDRTIDLNTMVKAIEKHTGKKAIRNVLPAQPGDMHTTWADIDKSKNILGYNPAYDFDLGIAKFVDWLKKQI